MVNMLEQAAEQNGVAYVPKSAYAALKPEYDITCKASKGVVSVVGNFSTLVKKDAVKGLNKAGNEVVLGYKQVIDFTSIPVELEFSADAVGLDIVKSTFVGLGLDNQLECARLDNALLDKIASETGSKGRESLPEIFKNIATAFSNKGLGLDGQPAAKSPTATEIKEAYEAGNETIIAAYNFLDANPLFS